MRIKNMQEDPSALHWKVDMFKNFKQLGLLEKYDSRLYIDLWKYFEKDIGWKHD